MTSDIQLTNKTVTLLHMYGVPAYFDKYAEGPNGRAVEGMKKVLDILSGVSTHDDNGVDGSIKNEHMCLLGDLNMHAIVDTVFNDEDRYPRDTIRSVLKKVYTHPSGSAQALFEKKAFESTMSGGGIIDFARCTGAVANSGVFGEVMNRSETTDLCT